MTVALQIKFRNSIKVKNYLMIYQLCKQRLLEQIKLLVPSGVGPKYEGSLFISGVLNKRLTVKNHGQRFAGFEWKKERDFPSRMSNILISRRKNCMWKRKMTNKFPYLQIYISSVFCIIKSSQFHITPPAGWKYG